MGGRCSHLCLGCGLRGGAVALDGRRLHEALGLIEAVSHAKQTLSHPTDPNLSLLTPQPSVTYTARLQLYLLLASLSSCSTPQRLRQRGLLPTSLWQVLAPGP